MTRSARLLVLGSIIVLAATLTVACYAQTASPPPKTFGAPPGLRDQALALKSLFEQRKLADAHAFCEQGFAAAADDETRAFYLRYDAEAYMIERAPKCVEVLMQVIEQFPQTMQVPWAKLDLGEVYAERSHVIASHEKFALMAMSVLDDFINSYPQHEKIVRAFWLRGRCRQQLGDGAGALADYQQAVAQYPGWANSDLCLKRAIQMLQKAGRWDEAIAAARQYRTLFPGREGGMASYSIAMSYARKGDSASAIHECDDLVAQFPSDKQRCALALFQKALCQKVLGQVASARDTLTQLVRSYPDQYIASRAKQQLELLSAQ